MVARIQPVGRSRRQARTPTLDPRPATA
jgi:hypothetical protein